MKWRQILGKSEKFWRKLDTFGKNWINFGKKLNNFGKNWINFVGKLDKF